MNFEMLKNLAPWEWPENAGRMIQKVLRDRSSDMADRLAAAEMAGDIVAIDDDLVDTLLSILRSGDEPEQLQAEAAVALGPVLEYSDTMGFEDDLIDFEEEEEPPISEEAFNKAKESLRKLYMDATKPKYVRRRILEASVRAPQEWHQEAVRAAWGQSDQDWRLTAIFCMQYVPGFDAQITEALKSKEREIYYYAISAAGEWGIEAGWPHVTGIINSKKPDKEMLLVAIDAAVGIRPRDAVSLLNDLLDSTDQDIVDAAMEALSMAGELADMDDEDDYDVFDDYADDYDEDDR